MTLREGWQAKLAALQKATDALWLAELGAWLHNIGKLRKDTNTNYRHPTGRVLGLVEAKGISGDDWDAALTAVGWLQGKPHYAALTRARDEFRELKLPQKWLNETPVRLPDPFPECVVADLIEFQMAYWYGDGWPAAEKLGLSREQMLLPRLLQRCHHWASNVEREGDEGDKDFFVPRRNLQLVSSVFGDDRQAKETWDVWSALAERHTDRAKFLENARSALGCYPADPRIPINDVTLYDIGLSVAAFLKAEIAKGVMEGALDLGPDRNTDTETRKFWLLRIRVDEAAVYGRGLRIPDVLGRQALVKMRLDGVKARVETGLCLGNEVYRDDWGSVFLLPSMKGDGALAEMEAWMREEVAGTWRQEGWELLPEVKLDEADHRGLRVEPVKLEKPAARAGVAEMVAAWGAAKGQPSGVCPVCGVRPLGRRGPEVEAKQVCGECKARRGARVKPWLENELAKTVWMEEAADSNGRVCVLGMRLRLDEWLKAKESLIETLALRRLKWEDGQLFADEDKPKRANFARQRRVWESAEEFWEEATEQIKQKLTPRMRATFRLQAVAGGEWEGHGSFVLVQGSRRLAVVHRGGGEFLSAENLERAIALERMTGKEEEWLASWKSRVTVEETTGYGRDDVDRGFIDVVGVAWEPVAYAPGIVILTRPEETVVVLPAEEAWRAAMVVEKLYGERMGRVRDRLALEMSLVFAGAELPVAALLDGVRRMMNRKLVTETRVVSAVTVGTEAPEHLGIEFQGGLRWTIPGTCGFGIQRQVDRWYGWMRLGGGGTKLARLLEKGDQVQVAVSNFDFEYLDGAGDRFTLAYDEGGRRRGEDRALRPYPLERMAEFEVSWSRISEQLHNRQANELGLLLTEKRAEWRECEKDGKVWDGFAEAVLGGLEWKDRKDAYLKRAGEWWAAAQRGVLEGTLELHLKILKERTERSKKEGESHV